MIPVYEKIIFKNYCDYLMKRITEQEFIDGSNILNSTIQYQDN